MGEQRIVAGADEAARRRYARALLDDLDALEQLIDTGRIESGVRRIGFEQECFLVDADGRPAPVNDAVLARLDDPDATVEIGRFNCELNVPPLRLAAGCLDGLAAHLERALARLREAAQAEGADVFLGGILPSIEPADLTLDNLTPRERYRELDREVLRLAGGTLRTLIQGRDNLQLTLDNVMLEACNTSIQVHLQVAPDEFARLYNVMQLVAAPVLAAAANAPLLLQHRLWHESRIPAFEQAVDVRSGNDRARGTWQRVHFGDDWVHESVLELYRDLVSRHRILLTAETGESSLEILARGEIPALRALQLHNGSVYRWNRACYGVADGIAHLRIEHRPLPAGPTVQDEVANTALLVGLVLAFDASGEDVRETFRFSDVKANFVAAARYGLDASLRWRDAAVHPARELLTETLLPLAQEGLRGAGLPPEEVRRHLDVVAERVRAGRTGARWQLEAFERFESAGNRARRSQLVTRAIMERQWTGDPVHAWDMPTLDATRVIDRRARVADIMTTDVFTVGPDDLIDLAVQMMSWKHVRHVPVVDDAGRLVGLLAARDLLRGAAAGESVAVRDVMHATPETVSSQCTCREALAQMRRARVGCLPVVLDDRLVGIVSERDFLTLADAFLNESTP